MSDPRLSSCGCVHSFFCAEEASVNDALTISHFNRKFNDRQTQDSTVPKHHSMKAYKGSGQNVRCIVNNEWRRMVSFTFRSLYHRGKSPRYSLDRKLSVTQSWSGCSGKENSNPFPCRGYKPGSPAYD